MKKKVLADRYLKMFKSIALGVILSTAGTSAVFAADRPADADNFYRSDKVEVQKVTFKNQYKMNIAGNLYLPKDMDKSKKHAAIIVGHPMGAVKEQSADLYAVAPELYAETFSAAVDYLGTGPFADREKIGAIGICGSGSFAISAAKIDPRLKAVATISMYDMGAANRNGLNHSLTLAQRKQIIADAAEQRYVEFQGGATKYTSGTVHEITEKSNPIEREFYDFYRTPRGEFTPAGSSPLLTTHPTLSSNTKFMNFYPFNDIETISPRPLLFITGDQAHSKEFSEDAYKRAAEPKELYYVAGAGHVDLYDRVELIPFDKLESFFKANLK